MAAVRVVEVAVCILIYTSQGKGDNTSLLSYTGFTVEVNLIPVTV